MTTAARVPALIEQFEHGLDAPICLTWELTYACNLACVHCLSSSGKRDPGELSTRQCKDIIDELERMQVFYVNIGGGEPTVRPDFWELVDYATEHHVGVKFSTNGVRITPEVAARLAASDYVDVQISLDGATAEVNDAVRGPGSFAMAVRALENLAAAGFRDAKISVVVTRHNVDQLDEFAALASRYGATLRITRLRYWEVLVPTILIVACLAADALSARTVSSVLFTAAVVAYVYGGSQRYVSATAIRLLLAASLAIGVAVFAASGGSWSAAANAVAFVTVVPAVWFFALSVRARTAMAGA